uniref:Tudor domain-containing protein n=1 Tax=Glossina brevipalpis TaxID=37001 RepID=A0A1A9WB02_9MUSC
MQKESVVITHFINPHLFWYHKVDDFRELYDIQQQQQQLIGKSKRGLNYYPQLSEKVAVNFVPWNQIIRAEVLCEAQRQKEFVVWALDYGFPFRTKKEHIYHLPTEMARHIDHIRCGGLANILPAEIEYDIMESDLVMKEKDYWRQNACEILEKFFLDAASITFVEQFESTNNHHWGNLIVVNYKGKVLDVREHLLSAKFALEDAKKFRDINLKLKTISIPQYLSNCGKLTAKTNTIKADTSHQCVVQKSASAIDEFAKRKVEDWHARNKSQNDLIDVASVTESNVSVEMNVDDVTFDDSVPAKNFTLLPNENGELNIAITNYIGKAGTLAKIRVGRDDLKWPGHEHFKVKLEINSEENSSSSVPTQQMRKLRNKYGHAEEDRLMRLMRLRRKYKEIETRMANSYSLQTIVSSSSNIDKKLVAKRHESAFQQELSASAGSLSSLEYQKCERLEHANSSSSHNESELFTVGDIQPSIRNLKNIKDKYSHGTPGCTHSVVTNEGKENVKQNLKEMGDEIISNGSSVNITTNEHEALANSDKLKSRKKRRKKILRRHARRSRRHEIRGYGKGTQNNNEKRRVNN